VIKRHRDTAGGKALARTYDYVFVGAGSAGCVVVRRLVDGTDASVLCSSYLHPVGTCAIWTGREAVVDAELRVRGVESLRVADASVMPTIPSANANAPNIMIGEFAFRLLVDAH